MTSFLRSQLLKILLFPLFLLMIFTSEVSVAQVKFSVVCPQKKIGKNDVLQVSFKVENASNVESIIPPAFKNFTVVGGPNQQSGMTSINGKVNQYVSVGFYLKPKSTGKFNIGSAKARADGKNYTTNPVAIAVTNQSTSSQNNTQPNPLSPFSNFGFDFPVEPQTHQFDDYILKPGEDAEEKVQKDLFINLDVDKTTCFIGEPIIASYKVYTRLRSQTTITNAPSFNGFSVSDLNVNDYNNYTIEEYNGRKYNVYTLRKVQLYPLQAGSFTLDPLVSNNRVTFIKSEYANSQSSDRFYDMLRDFADATTPETGIVEKAVTLKSKPVTITVKPLPVENKPKDFKGAVGHFSIEASLEKNNITTDDAGNLIVTISGQGNIDMINSPKIEWPQGLEGYDPKVKDNVDKAAVPMKGSKTYTFPFTTAEAGNYQIDSISFSYFDPVSSSYKTLRTAPLVVNVKKGTGISNNEYVKNSQKNRQSENGFFTNNRTDIFIGIALVIAVFLSVLYIKNKKNEEENTLEKNIKIDDLENNDEEKTSEFIIPENPLLEVHEKLIDEDSVGFYHTLHYSLKQYLSSKFKIPAEEFSKKRLNEELDKRSVGLGTSHLLNSLLDEVELNLYAPSANSHQLKSIYEKASEVISLLQKQCENQ